MRGKRIKAKDMGKDGRKNEEIKRLNSTFKEVRRDIQEVNEENLTDGNQELQENYDRLKSGQEAAKVDRETEGESDFDLQDPFSSHSVMEQGTPRHTAVGGPPATLTNMFDAVPFDATNNLNLANPNIRDQNPQENGNTKSAAKTTLTPARGGDESSESECEITN